MPSRLHLRQTPAAEKAAAVRAVKRLRQTPAERAAEKPMLRLRKDKQERQGCERQGFKPILSHPFISAIIGKRLLTLDQKIVIVEIMSISIRKKKADQRADYE